MFLSHLPINVPNYIMGRSGIQFSSLTPALSGHNFSINMPNQFRSAPPLPGHQQPLASIKLWNFSSSIFQFVPMFLLTCKSPLFCTFHAILTSSSVPILPSTKSIISDWRWRGRALSGQHRSCGDLERGERDGSDASSRGKHHSMIWSWDWERWNQFPSVQTGPGRLTKCRLSLFKALQRRGPQTMMLLMLLPILFFKTKPIHCGALAPAGARDTAGSHLDRICKDPISIGLVLILSALLIPLILSTKQIEQILRNYPLLPSCFIEYLLQLYSHYRINNVGILCVKTLKYQQVFYPNSSAKHFKSVQFQRKTRPKVQSQTAVAKMVQLLKCTCIINQRFNGNLIKTQWTKYVNIVNSPE